MGRWGAETQIPVPRPEWMGRGAGSGKPNSSGRNVVSPCARASLRGAQEGLPALLWPNLGPGSRPPSDVCQRALQTVIPLSAGRPSPAQATHPG